MKQVARFLASLAALAVLGAFTITPLCGAMFQCGCDFAHGVAECNIFDPGAPHCPWCTQGFRPFWGMFAVLVAASGLPVWAALRWFRPALWAGLAAGLAGYLFWAGVFGLAYALYTDYPLFFWIEL